MCSFSGNRGDEESMLSISTLLEDADLWLVSMSKSTQHGIPSKEALA